MKRILLSLALLLAITFVNAQTIVYHENFDLPSNADSVTASGAPNNFGVNSRLYVSGTHSDSAIVSQIDTTFLTSNSFSTIGFPFTVLYFSHICKIEFFDAGEVQVSVNNGPWTQLTASEYINPGNSQFVSSGNKFNSLTYPESWDPINNMTKPTQNWWRDEVFDISAIAGNQTNVRIRFALRDGNANGANLNHGWFIDNILIKGSINELLPPSVQLVEPSIRDTIFNSGPFDIYAYISDPSGIDTAYITYKVNSGQNLYVPLTWISDSTYKGTIPSYSYKNTIRYSVTAIDNTVNHNLRSSPSQWFYIKKPYNIVIVGNGTGSSSNLPVNGSFNYSWGYMIYKVNELNYFKGKIDSLAFYLGNNVSSYLMQNQRIFIGHTGNTSIGNIQPDTTTMTRVFKGDLEFSGTGWFRFKLGIPFIYNGSSNLLIYWVNKDGSAITTNYPGFRYTSTLTTNCAYKTDDFYSNIFPTSTGTTTLDKPNLRISQQPIATANDAGIYQVINPTGTVVGSVPSPIKVYVKNYGADTLRKVTVKWMLDGVFQDSIPWTGKLAEAVVSLPYTLGSSLYSYGQHTIKVWTFKPNNVTDPNRANDTATMNFYSCNSILSGTYSIGAGGNFPTFAAAMVGLQYCGINGPVTFNVLSGTYTGQLTVPAVSGSSSTNTVTFQSSSGNNASVIIQYAASGATDNWVVRLNGADNIIFKNLTIKSTSSSAYARVIELIGGANNNRFEGNIIQGLASASQTTAGVYSGPSDSDNDNIFIGNKILNSYYGVYLYGSQYVRKRGFQFINNEITGWNYYGIYGYYTDSIRIEENLFQDGPAASINNHIYLYYNDNGCNIIKNKIQGFGSGNFSGIYLNSTAATLEHPNIIANNFITQSLSNSPGDGIYLAGTTLTNVYYNSVNLNGISTTGRGLWVSGGTYGINIVNNILVNNGGGYAIYLYTTSGIDKCDYNDLYTSGTYLGYWIAPRTNLAAWRVASSKDSNSVSADPHYTSSIDLHTNSPVIMFKGASLTEITDDIDGDPRSQYPSIGADETYKFNYDIAIDSVISPTSSCRFTNNEIVKVKLINTGKNPMSNIDLYYSINSGTPIHEIYAGTIDTSSSIYYSFNVPVNLFASGNYLFDFYIDHSSDQNPTNDSINNKWVNGYFDLNTGPYSQGFEYNENFTDWALLNTDGSIYKWIMPFSSSNYARGGVSSAEMFNGSTNLGEDWLFSRCFNLEAGKTYSLSFWYRANNATPQSLYLKYGTGQNAQSMVNTLATLPAASNTTYQQSISQFIAPADGNYYFGWTGPAGVPNNLYLDDINLKIVPEQEASLDKFSAPETGCAMTSSEPVRIRIRNTGADTIIGNLIAYYKINNEPPVSAFVYGMIIPGDTILFTFPVTANLAVTSTDINFNFKSWISLSGDPIHNNDTLLNQVVSRHLPGIPTVIGDVVNYGQTATLQANSIDNILWYSNNASTTPFYRGASYTTPTLFATTTYYVSASNDQPGFTSQVGNGTLTSPSIPTSGGYDYSWSSSLYLPGELNFTGKIDTLAYYCSNTIQGAVMADQRIYIRHYSGSVLSDANNPNVSNMILVFKGSVNWSGPGWRKIPLDIPFDYDGVSSLELAWENWDGSYLNNNPYFQVTQCPINMAKYKNSVGSFPVGAGTFMNMRPNIRFINKGLSGCPSTKTPITATVIIPSKEIAVKEILSPVQGCTYGTEAVRVKLVNHGISNITPPFTVGYYISGNPVPYTETINTAIPAGDSIFYTFTTLANTQVTGPNTTFAFKVFAVVSGDPYYKNDTLSKTVILTYSPNDPICSGATVSYGSSATLLAASPVPVNWYKLPTGGDIIYSGYSFSTPVLYGNTTYYAESNTTLPGFTSQTGTGTSWTYYSPSNGNYDYSWSSCIYLANELNFLGRIDTLMYYTTNSLTGYQMLNQRIYMRHTNATAFTDLNSPNVSSMTLVFNGDVIWEGPGWNKIVLTTPYYFSGSSNLEIVWESRDGGTVQGFPYFASTNISTNMVKYGQQNGSFPTGPGSYYTYRPNVKMSHVGFGCPSNRVPVTATVTGLPPVDAGLQAIISPISPVFLGNHDIKIALKNFGQNTLTSVQINYKINGLVQTPYNWSGSLPTGGVDTVNVGTYNFIYLPYPGLNKLTAWTQNPNTTIDPTPANDTVKGTIDAHDPMNGAYFIRTANPDFNSFSEAVACLKLWGISGPVTIIADTGVYNEQVSIPQVAGASATNTITFQSITGVNTDVLIEFNATTSGNNYVVQVNGTDYLRFKNIGLRATSINNYGRVLELRNSATNNIFAGNKLEGLHISNNNSTNIYCYDIYSSNNTFVSNELLYGYLSVDIGGSPTNKVGGFKFIDNEFLNYYQIGVNVKYNDSVTISGNTFLSNSSSVTQTAIYADYCDNNSRFEKNEITYNGLGSFYGIFLTSNNTNTILHNWVSNNFISCTGSSGTAYGISCRDCSYTNVYFNSINIVAGTPATSRALYQSGGISNLNLVNNCFANQAGGYATYISTPGSVNASDFNNLYTNGSVLSYWGSDRNNILSLQAASSKEVHSKSIAPNYLSATNLHTYQVGLIGNGISTSSITTDIDNDVRNALHPCIGADELNPTPLDAGISAITAPTNPANAGSQALKVILANFGTNTINNVTIQFSVNGNPAGSILWSGTLFSFDTIIVPVGNVILSSGNTVIRAWTSMPNGHIDTTTLNDTARLSVIVCAGPLAGNYTIGGVNPDYYSINDAVTAISFCGVSAPVTFNIANGTYYERLKIGAITGASASNTITFQSQSGNNNDVVIQAAGTNTTNNHVVQLDGAKFLRFKNITIKNNTASNFGIVVSLLNEAANNIFQGNRILSVNVTTNSAAPVYGTGVNIDFNKFIDNELKGGYYGVYLNGLPAKRNQGNEFTNNSITDYFNYGLYLAYNDSLIVGENNFRNVYGANSTYGIYSNYGNNGCRYEKNNIYGDNSGAFYGINISNSDGSQSKPIIIANNMISQINGNNSVFGLYITYCSFVNIFYNSVNINGGSSTSARALYTLQGNSLRILNNNLVAYGLGYAYYIGTISAIIESDYNNLFTTNNYNLAYWNTMIGSLSSLQSASGMDLHSVSGDPVFVSKSNLHATSATIDGKGKPISGFTTDIDGDMRNTTTPDIGADEFTALPYDISVVAFIQPSVNAISVGSSNTVTVQIRNYGASTVTSIPVSYRYLGGTPVTATWTGTLMTNQTTDYTFALPFNAAIGTNSLCAYTSLSGDQNIHNDTLCMDFTGVTVFLVPYADNFEGFNYFYDAGQNSSWELGVPASSLINTAHSPTHAWKTNLDGYYNSNELSFLYTPHLDFSMVKSSTLDFWHYFDTEINVDGCRIKYSVDGGTNWITLGYVADTAATNWYNSNPGGTPGWTGSSSGWIHSTYNLSSLKIIMDCKIPVRFRFEFYSNGTMSNFDGWAIDDISFTAPQISKDAGVIAILSPTGATQTSTPVTVQVTLKNFGTDTLQSIPVKYSVNKGLPVTDIWHGLLSPGGTANFTFGSTYITPGNAYDLCVYTERPGDTYWNNDTTCGHFNVIAAPHDVGVTAILLPTDGTYPIDTNLVGSSQSVKITIKNFGSSTETSIPISFTQGSQTGSFTWTGNLLSGQTADYQFTSQFIVPWGSYQLCAKTQMTGDVFPTNDNICHTYFGFNVGINSYDYSQWELLQNMPNPANNSTSIGFEIPVDGKVRVEILDILGNSIFVDEKEYQAGRNKLEINVRNIPAGMYFYSAMYKDMKRTKRMIITR